LQDDTIEQARANLEGAEAERNRAALDFTRYAHLVQDSWATRQRFETAKADAEKASAGVAAAKAALASAQQQHHVLLAQRKDAVSRERESISIKR
jgi:membrane fusion protein (multidrug efflux system)